jgi:hypothetical protein
VIFSDEERAELIAALSLTADMVGILLKQLDLLLDARDTGLTPNRRVVSDLCGFGISEESASWRRCARGSQA